MGYTHYWKMLKVPEKTAVQKVIAEVKTILSICGAPIQLEFDDSSPPIVNE
jgi:hypothetical protein